VYISFAHNVGGLTNATAKQIRGFHQRRADLSKARALKVMRASASTACQRCNACGSKSTIPLRLCSCVTVLGSASMNQSAGDQALNAFMLPLATRSIKANWR